MTYPISEEDYSKFVDTLAASPFKVLDTLNGCKVNLLHAAVGIGSEAGEIGDEIKKHVFYGAELNYEAICKEMGDIEWYLQLLRNTLGVSRQEIVACNMAKLRKRHPNGFSTESAIAKADAVENANKELQLEAAKNLLSQQSQDLHQTLP